MKSRPQKRIAPSLNANNCLDPELKEIIVHLDAEQRLNWVEKMTQWANQVTQSVAIMTGKPVAKSAAAPKIPKGFVMVNLSTREQKELCELSRECGGDLRGSLRWALCILRLDLKERAKIKRLTGSPLFVGVNNGRN